MAEAGEKFKNKLSLFVTAYHPVKETNPTTFSRLPFNVLWGLKQNFLCEKSHETKGLSFPFCVIVFFPAIYFIFPLLVLCFRFEFCVSVLSLVSLFSVLWFYFGFCDSVLGFVILFWVSWVPVLSFVLLFWVLWFFFWVLWFCLDCKTVFFFLKISKEIGKAWRKSLTHAKRASRTRPFSFLLWLSICIYFVPKPK